MDELVTKKTADELMKMEGETRGISIKGDIEYVVHKKGKDAVPLIEEEMRKLGHPIDYQSMKAMAFYPVGLEAIMFLVLKKLFDFSDEEFEELGRFNSKLSLVLRLFMKHFVSLKSVAKAAPDMWRKLYSVGDLEVAELNEEKRYVIVRIKNFGINKYHCLSIMGYIKNVIDMITGSKTRGMESKCVFKGGNYHEFELTW